MHREGAHGWDLRILRELEDIPEVACCDVLHLGSPPHMSPDIPPNRVVILFELS